MPGVGPPWRPPYDRHNTATSLWYVRPPPAAPVGTTFRLRVVPGRLSEPDAADRVCFWRVVLSSGVPSLPFCLVRRWYPASIRLFQVLRALQSVLPKMADSWATFLIQRPSRALWSRFHLV